MCNTPLHLSSLNNVNESFTNLSTLHLLRTCNRFLLPHGDIQTCYSFIKTQNDATNAAATNLNRNQSKSAELIVSDDVHFENNNKSISLLNKNLTTEVLDTSEQTSEEELRFLSRIDHNALYHTNGILPLPIGNLGLLPRSKKTNLPAFQYIAPSSQISDSSSLDFPLIEMNRSNSYPMLLHRRSRGEKRPIPDEQKDEKYYERRKRNNEAAKKSRDARKLREDRVAFRAALLEQENSILRTQLLSLRDELHAMRQVLSTTSPTTSTAETTKCATNTI